MMPLNDLQKRQTIEGEEILTGKDVFNVGIFDGSSTQKLLVDALTNLYSNPEESVVRELLSNAIDATSFTENPEINIEVYNDRFVISDNGCGMSTEELKDNYIAYGNSSKTYDMSQIGAYGFGAKAPLAIASKYTVETCDGKESSFATVAITKDGVKGKITPSSKKERGTTVTVYLNDWNWCGDIEHHVRKYIHLCGLDHVHFRGVKPFKLIGKNGDLSVYVSHKTGQDYERIYEDWFKSENGLRNFGISTWARINGISYHGFSYQGDHGQDRDFFIVKDYKPGEIQFPPAREKLPSSCDVNSEISKEKEWVNKTLKDYLEGTKEHLDSSKIEAIDEFRRIQDIKRDASTIVLKYACKRAKVCFGSVYREHPWRFIAENLDCKYIVVDSNVKIKVNEYDLDREKIGIEGTGSWYLMISDLTHDEKSTLESSRYYDVTVLSEREFRSCIKKEKKDLAPWKFETYDSFSKTLSSGIYDRNEKKFNFRDSSICDMKERYVVLTEWSPLLSDLKKIHKNEGFSVAFVGQKSLVNKLVKEGFIQVGNISEIKSDSILSEVVGEYESFSCLSEEQKKFFEFASFIISYEPMVKYVDYDRDIIEKILSLSQVSKDKIIGEFCKNTLGRVDKDKILEDHSKKSILKSYLKVVAKWTSKELEEFFPGVVPFDTDCVIAVPVKKIFGAENLTKIRGTREMKTGIYGADEIFNVMKMRCDRLGIRDKIDEFEKVYYDAVKERLKEEIEKACE